MPTPTAPADRLGSAASGTLQRARVPLVFVRPASVRARAASEANAAWPVAPNAPNAPVATVTVTERELDLLRRGLHRLLGEVSPNESAHGLVARLALAAAELETSAGRILAHPVAAEST